MFGGLREGIFECCNPASLGEPEFLAAEQHISSRSATNLYTSASGSLKLYFQRWQSDRHQNVRAVVFCHHGEAEHCVWYNALAVRLAAFGCTTFCPDVQGYGQSDGARGYFESFENLVCDFVKFCRLKWAEVLDAQVKGPQGTKPGLVFVGKGFGALVIMRALVELHELASSWGVTPVVVLISPAFQFADFISEQTNVSCGLNQSQCARQPVAQCARAPVAFAPPGDEGQRQKLEYMSRLFPKMIVTQPVDPDLVSRDPETIDRMNRDALCWRQGYRARVLAEIVHEQNCVTETLMEHPEVFQRAPALILHGTGDKLFSVHGSHSLHSVWCDLASKSGTYPRLKIYDGAFHQLLNEPNREEVMNDIAHFIAAKTGAA
jgi:alpha-beta hydrolase superfamily lysophospholipase